MPSTILRLPQVKSRVGLSRSSIYLAMSQGNFPQPVKLGARAVGWLESEVDEWIRAKAVKVPSPSSARGFVPRTGPRPHPRLWPGERPSR
jgi:prophage regulatory protein